MTLTYDPVLPELDPRFKPIDLFAGVRMKTAEEQARHAAEKPPAWFTCAICGRDTPSARAGFTSAPQPFPGNLCRACVDRHGRSWGLNANWRTGNRTDFHHMRALSAITHALLEETRPDARR